MRKVLFVLAELNDQDLDWIVAAGTRESFPRGQVLVRQGEPVPSLYLILRGRFTVTTGDNRLINTIGQGEVVGEISFLDSRPPTATVTAAEDSTVLSLPSGRLRSRLRQQALGDKESCSPTRMRSRHWRASIILSLTRPAR